MDKGFYEKKWEDGWSSTRESIGPIFYHRIRIIRKLIKKSHLKGKILDVGCGDGTILIQFQRNGNELYGCDISEKAVQVAKSKYGDFCNFTVGDITKSSSLPEGKFDVIICSEILEHIENDELAIKNLYTKLETGGYLLVTTPLSEKYWSVHDNLAGHVRRYEKDKLEKKITKNGFQIRKSISWGFPLLQLYYKMVYPKSGFKRRIDIDKKIKIKEIIPTMFKLVLYFDDFFINSQKCRNIFLLAKKDK